MATNRAFVFPILSMQLGIFYRPPPPVEVPPLIVNLLITKSSEAQVDKTVDILKPLTVNYLAGTLANTLADEGAGAGSRR